MSKSIIVVFIVGSLFAFQVAAVTDAQIKVAIIRSGQFVDNSDLASRTFDRAEACCEGDTNRFARILFELAQTNNVRIADRMIRCLGWYGTPAQLPFLYSMATNVQHGSEAVKSILRLEGVTSNSLNLAGTYLSMTNADLVSRAKVCEAMLLSAANINLPNSVRQSAKNMVYEYTMQANGSVMYMDYVLTNGDPSYRFSKRRLAVMRSVSALGVHPSSASYVTNAINELVAYPEANLPE